MVLHHNLMVCFVGTYTDKGSEGIYRINFNANNKTIEKFNLAYKIKDPTYFAIDRERHILYSTCRIDGEAGVSSFKYWPEQDSLNFINYNISEKKQPCHLSIDSNKQLLITSNYHENKMIVYNTLEGIILNYPKTFSHEGKSINHERQDMPHIHSSILTKDNKYILSVDLGIDKIIVYELDGSELNQINDLTFKFPDGTGPRHIVCSNSQNYYVISELTSEIFVLKYKPSEESLFDNIQIISSTSPEYNGIKSGAAIRIHPSNKFLYTSDRGNNSINLFSILPDGKLNYLNSFSCEGDSPRDFNIDPSGNFLFCANEKSNNVSIFSIGKGNGMLNFITSQEVNSPTAIEFV
ncbi:lactonase family protein [Clostridium sp. SM-530-WT-3G]|uniref:lactonase family protein n=1 Tax=Clostridium sp. SM-530-WT-3G TaxID=2725303 RepID=UPI00145DCB10|nr:lactonase family protein [Clostridium sp. SM-530-WT-3G]NME81929.1 lactonase family protein [Clostridium sp. SM-530-WT-3G]